MNLSLNWRIVLLVWVTSGVLVTGMLFTGYRLILEDYQEIVAERESANIDRLSASLEQSLQLRLLSLEAFSSRLLNNEGERLSDQEIRQLLGKETIAKELFPDGLLVFDSAGTAIAETIQVPDRVGTNYADRSHFKALYQTGNPVISSPILGRTTGLPLISFLAPVFAGEKELVAIVGGVLDLSSSPLLQTETEAASQPGVVTLVIDPEHRLFVSMSEPINRPKPLPAPGVDALVDAAMANVGVGAAVERDEARYLVATQRLSSIGWVVLRAIPYEQAVAPARRTFRQFLLVGILAVLVVAAAGWMVARSLTRPLEAITRRIDHMANTNDVDDDLEEMGNPEVRSLTRAMNRLAQERRAVDQLKRDFISSVSHELRTPITAIYGGLKLLKSGVKSEQPQESRSLVDMALRNSERLQTLVSDLLDFNRLITGKIDLKLEHCRLQKIIDEAVEDIEPLAREHSITCRSQVPDDLWVEVDPLRFRQVLDNLLSNALKHSPVRGIVTVSGLLASRGRVRVTVSDQGDGVSEEFSKRIFQRFAQADQGNRRKSTGTGLGLAISKELIERMQGEVGFYNEQGAHFWVEVPGALE